MAADVRRWGGYCRRTSSIAAVTLGASGATLSTSTCWPLPNIAIRRPVDTADIWPAHAWAWACHARAPGRRYRTPAALAPPLSPGGAGASAPSALSTASGGCAAGFALRNVATSRSRVFTLVASRSSSLVTSANRDSQSRLSSLALDRRGSRSRLAASALMARASHAPARC